MKSTLYAIVPILCLAFSHEDEPDYKNILYGGILRWPIPNTTMEDDDVSKTVQTAVIFLEQRLEQTLRNSDGKLLPYRVGNLQKLKLVYTGDDRHPFLRSNAAHSTNQQLMSTLMVFGFTYTFQILWTTKDLLFRHHFVMTMYPQGTFHIYAYTSEYCNHAVPIKKHQASDKSDISSVSCDFISGQKSAEVDAFPTRSCRTRTVSNDHTCYNDDLKTLYEQFSGEGTSDYCRMKSQILFNITVMTYNIWNYNTRPIKGSHHYVDRIKRLEKVIITHKPDIIAFQEVRFENGKGGDLGPNQVKHLADMIKQYQFVYQPAQFQPNSLRDGRTEEGVAIFSRYPIIAHHYLKLFRNHSNSADRHQRICQHVEIKLPHNRSVHIFNTHLSLSHEAREQSVIQMWNYMKQFEGAAILTGDFNAEPQENAMKYIYKKTSLIDMWQHDFAEAGYTYSTIDKNLTKRIDYIFVRQHKNMHIIDAEILDDESKGDKEKAASDHLPIVGTVGFS